MSVNIVVNYAYQKLGAAALPEDQRWGFGKMHMNAERFPEKPDELEEVGRTIGLEKGYEVVAIQSIDHLEKHIDNSDVVLEGNIVEDSK